MTLRSVTEQYDEGWAFVCAAKGVPYTEAEWDAEVERLHAAWLDAKRRLAVARDRGVCLPERYDPQDAA